MSALVPKSELEGEIGVQQVRWKFKRIYILTTTTICRTCIGCWCHSQSWRGRSACSRRAGAILKHKNVVKLALIVGGRLQVGIQARTMSQAPRRPRFMLAPMPHNIHVSCLDDDFDAGGHPSARMMSQAPWKLVSCWLSCCRTFNSLVFRCALDAGGRPGRHDEPGAAQVSFQAGADIPCLLLDSFECRWASRRA